jgi:hypothetical protein
MSTLQNSASPRRAAAVWPFLLAGLTVLLAAAASAAVVLAILHFSPRPGNGPTRPADGPIVQHADEPVVQKGDVTAEDAGSTTVLYAIPYHSPPHLTIKTKSGSRKFAITRQDELGFTWTMALTEAETKGLADLTKIGDGKSPELQVPEKKPASATKPSPGPHEFTWEAKGLREKAASPYPKPYVQKGSFTAEGGQEGEVFFTAAYAVLPNVTLGESTPKLSVTTVTPLGFTWKNPGTSTLPPPSVSWTSLGTRATTEQVAQLARAGPQQPVEFPMKVAEQKGTFTAQVPDNGFQVAKPTNLKGEVHFPHPYASPPHVTLKRGKDCFGASVSQTTSTGFKWEGIFSQTGPPHDSDVLTWSAKGILATSVPVEKSGK